MIDSTNMTAEELAAQYIEDPAAPFIPSWIMKRLMFELHAERTRREEMAAAITRYIDGKT